MFRYITGILKLDRATTEEIEVDPNATKQALLVVTILGILPFFVYQGLDVISRLLVFANGESVSGIDRGYVITLVFSALGTLAGTYAKWLVWSLMTHYVGTIYFQGVGSRGDVIRVVGFGMAAGVLGVVPVCGSMIGWVWSVLAVFIAVRQTMDIENRGALIATLAGAIISPIFALFGGFITMPALLSGLI